MRVKSSGVAPGLAKRANEGRRGVFLQSRKALKLAEVRTIDFKENPM